MTHVNVGHISPQKPMTVTKLIDLWASKFPKLGALRLEWAPFYASDGMNLVEYRVIAQAKGLSPDLRWVSKICIDLQYPRPVTALKSGPEMPWTVWQGHSMRWEKTATALSALRPVSRLGHSFLADRSRKSVRFKLFFFPNMMDKPRNDEIQVLEIQLLYFIYHKMVKQHLVSPHFPRWSRVSSPMAAKPQRLRRWPPQWPSAPRRSAHEAEPNWLPNVAPLRWRISSPMPLAARCCKMLQVHGLVFGGFPMDFCHLLLVSKSCDLDVVARCRTSSRWKPATRTLARGWGSQIKDEVDGLLGT